MRWFDAAFGHFTWLGQLAGLVLVIALCGQASVRMRFGIIAAAVAALLSAVLTKAHGPLAFWAVAVIAVNTVKIAQVKLIDRQARFSYRDEHLRAAVLGGLSRAEARALIDCGNWVNGKTGERLMSEGEIATHLYFLHAGSAAVFLAGVPVGTCQAGDLIGDATAISGAPATATVNLSAQSELWCIWADELRRYVDLHPSVRSVLERGLNDALRGKLSSANQRLSQIGGA